VEAGGGSENGNLRVEKRVQVKVEESESEDSKSESETPDAFDKHGIQYSISAD